VLAKIKLPRNWLKEIFQFGDTSENLVKILMNSLRLGSHAVEIKKSIIFTMTASILKKSHKKVDLPLPGHSLLGRSQATF
jgi:hypothetical protein